MSVKYLDYFFGLPHCVMVNYAPAKMLIFYTMMSQLNEQLRIGVSLQGLLARIFYPDLLRKPGIAGECFVHRLVF